MISLIAEYLHFRPTKFLSKAFCTVCIILDSISVNFGQLHFLLNILTSSTSIFLLRNCLLCNLRLSLFLVFSLALDGPISGLIYSFTHLLMHVRVICFVPFKQAITIPSYLIFFEQCSMRNRLPTDNR